MPTQTYTDNSRGKVVNIIPKRTIRHALKTEKKMGNPLKTHQNTLVFHLPPMSSYSSLPGLHRVEKQLTFESVNGNILNI